MKKTTNNLFYYLLLIPLTLFAQQEQSNISRFNIEGNTSLILIKSDVGFGFGGGFGYQVSKRIGINLGYLNGTIEGDLINDKYGINKYSFNIDYRLNSHKSKYGIESIIGFSYISFDDKLNLNDGNGFGYDLGVNATLTDNKWKYGLKIVSTYNSRSPGAFLEIGTNIKYTF
ncbi:MAG: hypothetical protein ED556_00690 [Winogradskyella sp.]|uniref:outer membrane beta-barrel protein n=1 Tax=Winogradskyella sp. TaxID=1883156 RepID=UPI000F3B4019|nr:outer membrane beta-barrel protein [Winogradskyella sp.]RNC87739.1 MAG: hypothetical protein ED556_00690 [Winogradskyella sp.]